MKKFFYLLPTLILVFFLKCGWAQNDSYNQRFLGRMDVRVLQSHPDFFWFATNYNAYQPESSALKSMETSSNGLNFVVFGNIMEDNSKQLIPEFYKIVDLLKISRNRVLLYILDADKKSPQGFENNYFINETPAIIVLKNGVEFGRVEGNNSTLEGALTDIFIKNTK